MGAKESLTRLLSEADIEVNGNRPWDLRIHDERTFGRIISQGSLGAGESYMDGWWDSEQLDELICRLLRARLENQIHLNAAMLWTVIQGAALNLSRLKPFQVGNDHYDVGNDLYQLMLDQRLTYTSGYWKDAITLDEAQEAKLDLVCRKLGLKEGDRVLDIGSGWGSFINFAAEKYGAHCTGLTVSNEQARFANANRFNENVETKLQDYMQTTGQFDHIVSLGMFEHVGRKNYRKYMKKVKSLLKQDGLFLLHTIGKNRSALSGDSWFSKYIFPNSMVPSYRQIAKASSNVFALEDWHNFGADYDATLMSWWNNFDTGWDNLKGHYDERFYRMWKYYLLVAAGSFRARKNNLWQIVFSGQGVPGGYTRVS